MVSVRRFKTEVARPGVIFDRDGVLNVDRGYVHRLEDLAWIPGAAPAIARLNRLGLPVLVATNQSGVARGLYSEADVDAFHAGMQAQLADAGAHIDQFYSCPFHADAVIDAFRHPDHPDRKPNPGMILRGMAQWRLDPARTLVIGDKASDIEAAARARAVGVLYPGGDLEAFVLGQLAALNLSA